MRDKLLDATAQVIRERGMGAATIREIAKAAGVAEGSVYNYFKDKVELIAAVHLERMPNVKLADAVGRLMRTAGGGSVTGHLEEFARAAIDGYLDLIPWAGMLATDPEISARVRAELTSRDLGPSRAHEAVAAYLRVVREQGRAELAMPGAMAATCLLGACHEYAFLSLFREDEPFGLDAGTYARRLVATLVSERGTGQVQPA